MVKEEEYELLPHKEILELKKEIEYLKKNPIGKGKRATDLMEGINTLNSSIAILVDVFRGAASELPKIDPTITDEQSSSKVEELSEKVNMLMDQNKQIAEALVAITDMVKTEKQDIDAFREKINSQKPKPSIFGERSDEPLSRPEPRMQNNFARPAQNMDFRPKPDFSNFSAAKMPPPGFSPTKQSSGLTQSGIVQGMPGQRQQQNSKPFGAPIPTPNPMPDFTKNFVPNSFEPKSPEPKGFDSKDMSSKSFGPSDFAPQKSEPKKFAANMQNPANASGFAPPSNRPPMGFGSPEQDSDLIKDIDAEMHRPEPNGPMIPPPDSLQQRRPTGEEPKKKFFSL